MKKLFAALISLCLVILVVPPPSGAKVQIPASGQSADRSRPLKPRGVTRKEPLQQMPQQTEDVGDLSTLAGAGVAQAQSVMINSESEINPEAVGPDALPTDEQVETLKQNRIRRVPKQWQLIEGPPAVPGPLTPPTELDSSDASAKASHSMAVAPDDVTLFKSHIFSTSEVPSNLRNSVQEPTVINMGNTVFYTGNWYAAKSSNGGDSFTFIDPYRLFPSVDNGFCCDQVTAYAPSHDMALWGLQYAATQTGNTFRIARAVGASGVANNNWVSWTLTPQFFDYPSGIYFDYPSFTVGANYLYVTTNPFGIATGIPQGSIIIRIPLSQLAQGGNISFEYLKATREDVISPVLCTEGASTNMYCAAFRNTTQIRIYRWSDSNSLSFDDVSLNAFTYYTSGGSAVGPDGTNWAGHSDSRLHAAYVSNGIIGLMFNASQDQNFPYPYVIHARFSESTRARVSQAPIWNQNYAYLYPTAVPNANGDLAGTLQVGGGSGASGFPYPGTAFWISDNVQPGGSSVGGIYSIANSNAGPASNKWGDYFSVEKHKDFPNTWVISSHVLNGGQSDSFAQPRYYWLGRQKNGPIQSAGGADTVGLYNPATSTFFLKNTNAAGAADLVFGYGPAGAGWKPIAGDWDGNGTDTVGLYNPSTSTFYLKNTNAAGAADLVFSYGPAGAGWIPLAGDWDGNGTDTVGLYNPSTSTFFLRDINSAGAANLTFPYGPANAGWMPLAGDLNNDKSATPGLYNPSTSTFFLKNFNAAGSADAVFGYGPAGAGWGPCVGDWNVDGVDTTGLYNPSTSTFFLKNTNAAGAADITFAYGPAGAGWIPVVGNWDGL